ncbi:unnamed protein product [Brugia timori]|uniref:MFS domain-containing protein n=1 Tax=Brugia timori TaxID=42155 RepID=A0A0R3R2V3_9BILA|nr:unnamed protein product [Brugia timori]
MFENEILMQRLIHQICSLQKIAGINEQMMSEALIEMTAQDELSVLMKKDEMEERKEGNMQYVPIVDGGWGWVVVVGSFFIHVFADGIVYSFGILLEIIMKEFDVSNAKASMIISLLTGLTLGMGPIASAITNKFGCRVTTILGSLIATTGCATSYYATSVEYLMVSVGCVMGIGFGLMYCPAIVIVSMYFEKKRFV